MSKTSDQEINLHTIWALIINSRLYIISFTVCTTLIAFGYIWQSKPIYQGTMLIEMGEVVFNSDPGNNKPTLIQPIEPLNDLYMILKLQTKNLNSKNLISPSPTPESNLLEISYRSTNLKHIENTLNQLKTYTEKHQQEKINHYQNVHAIIHPTNINIIIFGTPIGPEKSFILTLGIFGGLILSLFILLVRKLLI